MECTLMDDDFLMDWCLLRCFFIGVWFKKLDSEFKSLHDEVKEVKRDYVSKEVAGITNQSILDKLGAISEQLQSITKKLDNKADK